ncbi:MAG: hypothetical protein JXA64_05500 [Candidatus Fermentibacteraceae bacterium]|nr:hypothetical protein [Candidatus Fermentibacteraceae bacterium]MBN2608551.1 hypothetical protein [Candidatus Fermentibacteraceae bacterium]
MNFLLLLVSFAGAGDLGWVVDIGVFDREEIADPLSMELDAAVEPFVGILRVPDWSSLGNEYGGWMVYSGPYETGDEAAGEACRFLYRYPGVKAVWVGDGPPREERLPEATEFSHLYGLTPDLSDMYSVPPGWVLRREYPDVGEVEEWEQPELITLTLSDWTKTYCIDVYAGPLETRAVRVRFFDAEDEYAFASDFLKSSADALDAEIFEDAGRYTVVHRLPDPVDREGDRDFWVAIHGDTLEYGSRTRLFYGEMPYSWPYIPSDVRTSMIPDAVSNEEQAIDYLVTFLSLSGACPGQFPEGLSFGIAWMDGLPEEACRDYFDIVIREVHEPGGPGDPNVSPVVDRFRVYSRGEVIWYDPLPGRFVPFEDWLEPLFPER